MTIEYKIQKLKIFAKRHARANRLALNQSQGMIAKELGFSHWNALKGASKSDWFPSDNELAKIEAFVGINFQKKTENGTEIDPDSDDNMEQDEEGRIGEHSFQISNFLGDAMVSGKGWTVRIPEAPLAAPLVEIDERYAETSPVTNPKFLNQVIDIALAHSQKIRARMSMDWSRRSTKPDADGRVRHPIEKDVSDKWYCWDCDAEIAGPQIAQNLWHCPGCGANPLHIHAVSYGSDECETHPVKSPEYGERLKPNVQVVETRLTLKLNEENISTLIRCALLEEATNTSERLGAMLAEISLIDYEVVYITFDEYLWPEGKEPTQALAVAELLGVEVEQEISLGTFPFAWPEMGEFTSNTHEYTKMLLDAYSEHGVIYR